MKRQRGTFYTILTLSFVWGFIVFCICYSDGGWIWGLGLGAIVFYKGVRIHFRELKQPWDNFSFTDYNNASGWRQNWYRQNLN
ncbi:MAG: hypothetical protein HQL15_01855 [Candidatus Omnitrophica bacterium]|nr:hypothetical protein [Candidatus Omnitrophota bacterium]